MVPYIRYIHTLRLKYPNSEDEVIAGLKRYGLPATRTVIDISYDRFLKGLDKLSPGLASCLFMELEDDTFKAYSRELDVDRFFDEGRSFCSNLLVIVSDPLIKKHVECSLITRVAPEVIVADVNEVYRTDITLDDLFVFEKCFFDTREIYDTNSFTKYADMLSDEEREIKCKCRANGPEYTRWAIGATVQLSTKKITDDMIADAYFRYRAALSTAKDTEQLSNAIKLGNLVSKLIDKEVKLSDRAKENGDKDKTAKEDFGEQLCLFDEDFDKPVPLSEINKENQQPMPGPDV
jgi:hypothetical protein